jgi:hypothetical protein
VTNKTILGGVGGGGGAEEMTLEERRRRFEQRRAKLFSTAKSRGIAMAVDPQNRRERQGST